MPECGIGLVPDVGGSLLLARAPGRLGEYLGCTGARMGPGDALFAGFADHYIPEADWPALIDALCQSGDTAPLLAASLPAPEAPLAAQQPAIDGFFAGETLLDILNALRADLGDFAADTLKSLARNSPLSMAATVEMIHRLRGPAADIRRALELEYRFTHRAQDKSDFLEGIRAAVSTRTAARTGSIPSTRRPRWPPHRCFCRSVRTSSHLTRKVTCHEDRIYRFGQYGRADGRQPGQGRP